jgi:hypothetical protein
MFEGRLYLRIGVEEVLLRSRIVLFVHVISHKAVISENYPSCECKEKL